MKPPSGVLKYLSMRDGLGPLLTSLNLTGQMVEVGCLFGAYSRILINSWPGQLVCVDPWINQSPDVYKDGANKHDMEAIWRQVQKELGKIPRITLMRRYSLDAAGRFENESLAAVYLDGNHTLSNVREDIAAWWPKVKVGGIFCGHDFFCRYDADTNSDAQTAIMEFAERIGQWPHVTWCTSWFFLKTKESDDRYHGRPVAELIKIEREKTRLVALLAVAHPDFHLAKKWLRWAAQLSHLEAPKDRRQLIVYGSKALTEPMWEALREAANGIQPPPDFHATPEIYERGYAPSANYQFRTALECVEREYPGRATLWCESDTVPMFPGWVATVEREYQACGKPFMGDFFEHPKGISGIDHMTGTAVYPPDWRTLAPSLAILPEPRPQQGWDTLCAHETVPQMARAKTIQQIWRPPEPATIEWADKNIRDGVALFHQCKDSSMIDVLCDKFVVHMIPLDKPVPRFVQAATPVATASSPGGEVEIMIVSCRRDLEMLHYCLSSIHRHARGFSGVTLVVPEAERRHFNWVRDAKVVTFVERPGKGMLHHEIMICRADELCPNASAILHVDSDCMFWEPVTPADYMPGGKCLMVRERYEWIAPRNPNRLIWRTCVERAVGFTPEWETMVRHPNIYPRELYGRVRDLVETHTGVRFDDYVFSCENGFPQGFAEFPTLGAVAIRDMAEMFSFVDYNHDRDGQECEVPAGKQFQYLYRPGRDKLVEGWSHGGVGMHKVAWEKFTAGNVPKFWVK